LEKQIISKSLESLKPKEPKRILILDYL
jgi:hypothetical protein